MQDRTRSRIEQIDAFVAVVDHGGISAAARALDRDPSVISRRLDALEARLGIRLLSRTTRRITPRRPARPISPASGRSSANWRRRTPRPPRAPPRRAGC
jgi:DNA-binding transcriptional LysR family regulator